MSTGASTIEVLQQLRQDIIDVMASTKFILRKWKYYSDAPDYSQDNTENENNVILGETTKILSLLWNTKTDAFHYNLKSEDIIEKITKRNILAKISQIYDPLGWLGPIIVKAKIILQQLWQTGKD